MVAKTIERVADHLAAAWTAPIGFWTTSGARGPVRSRNEPGRWSIGELRSATDILDPFAGQADGPTDDLARQRTTSRSRGDLRSLVGVDRLVREVPRWRLEDSDARVEHPDPVAEYSD